MWQSVEIPGIPGETWDMGFPSPYGIPGIPCGIPGIPHSWNSSRPPLVHGDEVPYINRIGLYFLRGTYAQPVTAVVSTRTAALHCGRFYSYSGSTLRSFLLVQRQ